MLKTCSHKLTTLWIAEDASFMPRHCVVHIAIIVLYVNSPPKVIYGDDRTVIPLSAITMIIWPESINPHANFEQTVFLVPEVQTFILKIKGLFLEINVLLLK